MVAKHLCQRGVLSVQAGRRIGRGRFLIRRYALVVSDATRATLGKWQLGAVMPIRAGLSPVKRLARVGEQSGLDE